MLIDNHNRRINYLRLAVTDRCNLRCNYCMPEDGIKFASKSDLLSITELKKLSAQLVELGINKIRITGGEPFVRKDLMELLRHLASLDALDEISITTNGTLIGPYLEELKALGITSINLSMDAITEETFERITRRKSYSTVKSNLMRMIELGFDVRINCIVLDGQNIEDIIPMMKLQESFPVTVRFLEEMPFNGGTKDFKSIKWDFKAILKYLSEHYPDFDKLPAPLTSTSINYHIPGHKGNFGIIPSFSRTFCGSCNRLRITATGDLITCLYGKPVANIRQALRLANSETEVSKTLLAVLGNRAKNGFEAQEAAGGIFGSSMTSIGG